MRAKFFLAAALLLTAMQPVLADDLVQDVHETLYRPVHHGLLGGLFRRRNACINQSAVIAAPVCMEQPAVIAGTACGTALLTRDPMDLDIRRENLAAKISCLTGAGRLNACQAQTLSAALAEVNTAELQMRSHGDLTNLEARRLYSAMSRIGSHVDRWSGRTGFGQYIGLAPGFWY